MSVIAIRWAYSRPIKNPVAKNVLVFLSTHDFSGNKSFFKIQTICEATSYGRTAVKAALIDLVEQGYMKKNERYGEDGQQLSNKYELLIDEQFVEEFTSSYSLSTTPSREATTPHTAGDPPPGREATTNKNNAFKYNNEDKSSCDVRPKKAKAKSKSPAKKPREAYREENEEKHHWASKAKVCEPITKDEQICSSCRRPENHCSCSKTSRLPPDISKQFSQKALSKLIGRRAAQKDH